MIARLIMALALGLVVLLFATSCGTIETTSMQTAPLLNIGGK